MSTSIKPLDLNWALNADLPKPDFVLPGLEPEMFGLIVAPGGTGKTFFGLDVAVSVALGRDIAGGLFPATTPAKAVYVAAEESGRMLARRLRILTRADERTSEDLHRNLLVLPLLGEDGHLIKKGEATPLFEQVKAHAAGARLIIVDPVRLLHDGEENDSTSAALFVKVMGQLAKACGAAVIGIHHANRASSDNAGSQNAARGSSALVDGARWQLNLSRMSDKDAKDHDVPDAERIRYVALDVAKANYLASSPRRWLKRDDHGRLSLVELGKKRSKPDPYHGARLLSQ